MIAQLSGTWGHGLRSDGVSRHGGPEEKNLAVAPQHAPLASRAHGRGPWRLPELRRAQASPSCLRFLRPLCRPRSREGQELSLFPARKAAVTRALTVSIDAMGGDAGPGVVVSALLKTI